MCLQARTDIVIAANSRRNRHLCSDSWTHHTVLILDLKDRYPRIVHVQIVKRPFREALSHQREKPITQAPHNQHFTLGTPHSQRHTWTIFFFLIAHNYGCSCPNGDSSFFLVWVSFTHIVRKNYFAYSLTNLTFPEGPNRKTKVTASWNTALFFSWAWQFQKQIVMTTNNLEAIQPINLQRKQSSQPRRTALLL